MTTPLMKARRLAAWAREDADFSCREQELERCDDCKRGFCPRTLERNLNALHAAEKLQGAEYYLRDCECHVGTLVWHRKQERFIEAKQARIVRFVKKNASPYLYPKFIEEAFKNLNDSMLCRAYVSVYPRGYCSRGYCLDLCAIVSEATRIFWKANG